MERVRGDQQERGEGLLRGFQGGRQKGRELEQEQKRGGGGDQEGTRRKEEGRLRVSGEREEGPRRREDGRTDEGGRREEGRRRVEEGGSRREEGRLRIEEGFGRREERRREETFTNGRTNHSRAEGLFFLNSHKGNNDDVHTEVTGIFFTKLILLFSSAAADYASSRQKSLPEFHKVRQDGDKPKCKIKMFLFFWPNFFPAKFKIKVWILFH